MSDMDLIPWLQYPEKMSKSHIINKTIAGPQELCTRLEPLLFSPCAVASGHHLPLLWSCVLVFAAISPLIEPGVVLAF